jgi:type I restriction enzyme, S subunit
MNNNWPKVRLGDVLQRSDEAIELRPDAEYREITVKLWGKGVVLRGVVAGAEVASPHRLVAHRFQFILSRIDSRNGALGIVPDELDGAIVSSDFPVFNIATHLLLPSYLGWMCKTDAFVEECRRASEGTTNRVRLQENKFLAMEIPLPPLAEQRRIVARIEELGATASKARDLQRQATREAEALVDAEITRRFDQLRCSARAAIRTLGVGGTNPVQTGPFGAQLHTSDFVEEGVPVLNVGNVWPGGLRFESLDHVLPEKAEQLSRYSLRSGDLLFARSGATLGKVCLVPDQCDGWLMTGHLFRIRFDRERIYNRFAFAALRGARSVQDQVFGQVRGATRPGYNTTLLGNVELPLPPLTEQRQIVAHIDDLQQKVDALKTIQAGTKIALDALMPSILDKAFRGNSSLFPR